MFIKTIVKTDKKTGKRYNYYRLCEGYRICNKVRHRSILTLGKLEGIETKEERKILADRIESLIKGEYSLFDIDVSSSIEHHAQLAYKRIVNEQLLDINSLTKVEENREKDYHDLDLNSINHDDVRELGSEWLCKQTIDKLSLSDFLISHCGFDQGQSDTAIMHLISRAVYPCSEHKTSSWIKENSSLSELCNISSEKVSRFKLYQISKMLYSHKSDIEHYLSSKTNELFDIEDKIIFYDLTNTYFEGRKINSEIAQYGKSKEKRNDAKIVALAVVINSKGFIKYSKIYQGNISDVSTLESTINDLSIQTSTTGRKPVIVMDAGIVSEDNLKMLNSKEYDYICVSRTKLKDYESVDPEKKVVKVFDKRKNPIELKIVKSDVTDDTFLYVHSQQKEKKESSMNEHFSKRYEQDLENIKSAIHKKGGVKKIDKLWERIGRLKERYPTANKHYNINVIPDKDKEKAVDLVWAKNRLKTKSNEGVYFLRTSLDKQQEKTLWTIYNTLTEIEATFRVLKTDLSLRPVFHKTDESTQAHLFLGLLAYQIVATIRYQLKAKNINLDWRNIIRKMNTQKIVTTSIRTRSGDMIRIKKSSVPIAEVKKIYDALNYRYQPFYSKKSVVLDK